MQMGKQLNKVPKNESELKILLQELYKESKLKYESHKTGNFNGLLEIIMSEANILTSIHKIKSNKGSKTPGIDGKDINDYLQRDYEEIIGEIQSKFLSYKPNPVKRKFIPKANKNKLRPLGIPTVIDRICQECVRNVIEPIAEGQFFAHSYGFRPMRSADMAIERINKLMFIAKCNWVVEGDIKGFFDNIDHNVMIKSLWNIGIKDKRVLAIIKQMLQAGVMNECQMSELGTPQGGIISPLLANIYLDRFDKFITGQFERKELRRQFNRDDSRINSIRKHSNIKTAYFVRYADDWVILTDSYDSAVKLKYKAKEYLRNSLKLELSEEKTVITNTKKKPIKFLGFEVKMYLKNNRWCVTIRPEKERFDAKMRALSKELFYLRKTNTNDMDRLIQNINRINSIIIGIINYYQCSEKISVVTRKYAWKLKYTAYKSLKKFGGKWVRACEVHNSIGFNYGHKAHIPAIKYGEYYIGITDIYFGKWKKGVLKNQLETPYTEEGQKLYWNRMNKRPMKDRIDEINSNEQALYIRMNKHKIYNFEFFLNRPYAYNRDKGRCKICNGYLNPEEAQFHHVSKKLAKDQINKLPNLISAHKYCHELVHNDEDISTLDIKTQQKIIKYRNKFYDK